MVISNRDEALCLLQKIRDHVEAREFHEALMFTDLFLANKEACDFIGEDALTLLKISHDLSSHSVSLGDMLFSLGIESKKNLPN